MYIKLHTYQNTRHINIIHNSVLKSDGNYRLFKVNLTHS